MRIFLEIYTLLKPHSDPSIGGPFFDLQTSNLSWPHHKCEQGSMVSNLLHNEYLKEYFLYVITYRIYLVLYMDNLRFQNENELYFLINSTTFI